VAGRTLLLFVALAASAGPVSAAAQPPVVPTAAQTAIKRHVAPGYAYVPTLIPRQWSYYGWDSGQRHGNFPLGHGLNIWFYYEPGGGAGLGFTVFLDATCSLTPADQRFHLNGYTIAYGSTFEDASVWRCLRDSRGRRLRMAVNGTGTGYDSRETVERRVRTWVQMVATARRIR
jgi:hypothetical protein